jgi:hypothetical protein
VDLVVDAATAAVTAKTLPRRACMSVFCDVEHDAPRIIGKRDAVVA